MDIFKTFAVDPRLAAEGTWLNAGDARFLVGRLGGTRYRAALATRLEQTTPETRDGLLAEVFADTVLLNWENVEYQGAPFPYSRENAIRILTDPALAEFKEWLVDKAADRVHFQVQAVEALKNS